MTKASRGSKPAASRRAKPTVEMSFDKKAPKAKRSVTRSAPKRSAAKRAPAKAKRAPAKPAKKARARKTAPSAGLPTWSDLASKKTGAVSKAERTPQPSLVDGVPTLRFALLLVAACALVTLYVGHVYATQTLVAEVQQLRKENSRLVLKRNRLSGEFDRMTSPSVILDRAAAIGLETGSAYAPTIVLEPLD